jgi:uncharacterized protein (TIGR02118 family)
MPAHIVVLYNPPKDPAAFEKYYAATHVPLVHKHAKEIGFTEAKLVKFSSAVDGSPSPIYRKAELVFASMAALRKGVATNGFKQVGADLANFASGGVSALIGEETT